MLEGYYEVCWKSLRFKSTIWAGNKSTPSHPKANQILKWMDEHGDFQVILNSQRFGSSSSNWNRDHEITCFGNKFDANGAGNIWNLSWKCVFVGVIIMTPNSTPFTLGQWNPIGDSQPFGMKSPEWKWGGANVENMFLTKHDFEWKFALRICQNYIQVSP